MKKNEGFTVIGVCNDWASESFYVGPIVSKDGMHSFQEQDQSRRIKNGDKLLVKLLSGKVVKATAKVWEENTSYGDMGHTYTTKTDRLLLDCGDGLVASFDKVKVKRA